MEKENYEIWSEGVDVVEYPRTVLPKETDILIIGGGMAGLTNAYLLSKIGKKILLLEKNMLGMRVTGCTTGFLTSVIDTDPIRLIKKFGFENARLILESHRVAIDEVEKIIKEEKIECEFERCTNYIYANSLREEKYLIILTEGYKKLGINTEYKKDDSIIFAKFGYIEMPYHAKFHAIKYLHALAKIAVKNGVVIAENTEVLKLEDKIDYVDVEVKDVGIIKSGKVVSATYTPFGKIDKLSHLANLYREYVVEYKVDSGALIDGTYEDTLDPYNYFRIDKRNSFDRLMIGGADNLNIMNVNRDISFGLIRKYTEDLFNKIKDPVINFNGIILEKDKIDKNKIDIAVEYLKNEGVVVFPTETVYGIGANAFNESAVSKIFK
ncbi:MAG: FAD-dependent oxidoreductase, partial [bacterium]